MLSLRLFPLLVLLLIHFPSFLRAEDSLEAYVYAIAPKDAVEERLEVSGCYCEYQGRVLFVERHPDIPQGGKWCVPGGRVEKGETPAQAAVRVVREETSLVIPEEALEYRGPVLVRFPKNEIILHLFRVQLSTFPEKITLDLRECVSYCWVTYEEALGLPLIPGAKECMRFTLQE